MATINSIMAFEKPVEDWIVANLLTATPAITSEASRSTERVATPYVSIVVTSGGEQGRQRATRAGSTLYPDCWRIGVTVTVLTKRADAAQDHSALVGRVRARMAAWQDFAAMDNYGIGSLRETESTREVTNDFDHDKTVLSYDGVVVVKTAAWP